MTTPADRKTKSEVEAEFRRLKEEGYSSDEAREMAYMEEKLGGITLADLVEFDAALS